MAEGALAGVILHLEPLKGWGFITARDGTRYFFHRSGCIDFDALEDGVAVTFREAERDLKGPRAEAVRSVAR